MGFSDLNDDLFRKGCIDNNMCECAMEKEDAAHYFLRCSRYNVLRLAMVLNLNTLNTLATLRNILFGNANLSSAPRAPHMQRKCVEGDYDQHYSVV